MTVRPFAFITACLLAAGCAGRTSAPLADVTSAPGAAPTSSAEATTAPRGGDSGRRPRRRLRTPRSAAAPARIVEAADAFRIGPEDVLDIQVWKNAELSRVVPVRPDGMISLPLVNDIRRRG